MKEYTKNFFSYYDVTQFVPVVSNDTGIKPNFKPRTKVKKFPTKLSNSVEKSEFHSIYA